MSRSRLAACAVAALALCGCTDDAITQLVVVVDSDFDGFERVEIAVDGFTADVGSVASVDQDSPLPRRLTLVHDGGPLGPIAVEVSAFVAGESTPALVEHRAGIFFERDKALMLKVDLLFACIGKCTDACVEGPRCVTAAEATALTEWDSDFTRLPVRYSVDAGAIVGRDDGGFTPVAPDAGPSDDGGAGDDGGPGDDGGGASGGTGGDEGGSGGTSGDPDAGPDPLFPFDPTNFDAELLRGEDLMPVVLDCGTATFDSTALTFTDWCGAEPMSIVVEQSDDSELVVLAMTSLSVETAARLRLIGDRPVALVVLGDASVLGTIDASAVGTLSGGGALASCPSGASTGTNEGTDSSAAGGGSGGGFGTAGGAGGAGFSGSVHVSGGAVAGRATLSPLRGGCPGGIGGTGSDTGGASGGAGGAFQLTVAGELAVSGELLASGGGGQAGVDFRDGGGGGGSGGAILLEASSYDLDTAAVIAANGGGGAAGQPSTFSSPDSMAGEDGPASTAVAAGGAATDSGGDGGAGAALSTGAEDGSDGSGSLIGGGGGGGGGGAGRIRINGASSCAPVGVLSPQPSVVCPSCDVDCPSAPEHGCVGAALGDTFYYACTPTVPFDEASSKCSDADMELVRIDDQAENDWLAARGLDDLWIGASDSAMEDDWRWVQGDDAFWSGDADGNAVSGAFTSWDNNEPGGSGDAATLEASSGTWYDRADSADYPYVCELAP